MLPQSKEYSNSFSNKVVFIFIGLCSVWFFQIKGLGKGERFFELLGIALILFLLFLNFIYNKNTNNIKRNFSIVVFLVILSIIISSFSCWYFNHQFITATLYQSKAQYYFLFYLLLHYLYLKPEWIKDFIFYFAIFAAFVYIMQYIAYPTRITEAKMFIDRGTLRMNLPASPFRDLGYFLCIDMFFRTNKRKYAFGALFLLSVALMQAFRSVIAMYIGLALIYLLLNNKVKNKIMIFFMFIIIAITGFIVFNGIITAMVDRSVKESSEGSDYIRVKSGKFYFNEITTQPIRGILGNGPPDPYSSHGARSKYYKEKSSFYLSDIGIIGSFYKYGLLFVVIVISTSLFLIIKKLPENIGFIKLFILMHFLMSFNTFPLFEDESGIIAVSLIFYLIDCEWNHKNN